MVSIGMSHTIDFSEAPGPLTIGLSTRDVTQSRSRAENGAPGCSQESALQVLGLPWPHINAFLLKKQQGDRVTGSALPLQRSMLALHSLH